MPAPEKIHLRLAVPEDIPVLCQLIEASVRGLQAQDYTRAQIEGALKTVFGVDSQLIVDGTYIVAEARITTAERTDHTGPASASIIVAAVAGADAKHFMAATIGHGGRMRSSTPFVMRPKSALSSFIPSGRAAESVA